MDVEMEDARKVLEDEVAGSEERVEKDELAVKEVGDKQEESSSLVNDGIESPNEIRVEQQKQVEEKTEEQVAEEKTEEQVAEEKPKEQEAEVELKEKVTEEELKEHEVEYEPEKHEVEEELKEQEVEEKAKEHEGEEEPSKKETKMHLNESEQGLLVDKTQESEKAATAMGDDTEMGNDKIDGTENNDEIDATETGDDKTVATETVDDKIDALAMDDDKIDESKNDATGMDHDHGVIDETGHDGSMKMPENNEEGTYMGDGKHQEPATSMAPVRHSPIETEDCSVVTLKNELEDTQIDDGYESGTPEAQEAFNREVEALYKLKHLKFSPPKFYGHRLNCLKLWKAVIRLGGYDRVTATKGWRYIGEAFHPPKTCTTVSWTFRQFYEKSLLEYERHKVQTGELELPLATTFPEVAPTVEHEATNGHQTPGSGSGRARRDAAARAMQGWHSHRLLGIGEEKNSNNSQKREKSLKSLGSHKHKRSSEVEHSVKALRTETSRQVVTTVADIGPPANWVKINVRETKDCFDVYALVPGLLREEIRVQSDPAGRLVITGQPEQLDNPWGISSFKKVISLPARIDPLRTTAIVSLHGRLLVRVPFEQSNI